MPPLAPGVYIEELPAQMTPIVGVDTRTAGFIGVSQQGPAPVLVTSFAEFLTLAVLHPSQFLSLAVQGFFNNGGNRCYVVSIMPTAPLQPVLDALGALDIEILCCPDENLIANAAATLAADCENRKDRFCILQSPQPVIPDAIHQPPVHSSYAAYYYPWITVPSPGGSAVTMPPGGHVAGVYARIDTNRGVFKAPAGAEANLVGVTDLSQAVTDAQNTVLNGRGIDVIRSFPVYRSRFLGHAKGIPT